jgi:hypothetical protein
MVGAEGVEDEADVLQVFGPRRAVNQNVIQKHQNELAEIRSENIVHERLECGQGIGEAKGHHQELVVPLVSAERRIVDVVRVHPNLVKVSSLVLAN